MCISNKHQHKLEIFLNSKNNKNENENESINIITTTVPSYATSIENTIAEYPTDTVQEVIEDEFTKIDDITSPITTTQVDSIPVITITKTKTVTIVPTDEDIDIDLSTETVQEIIEDDPDYTAEEVIEDETTMAEVITTPPSITQEIPSPTPLMSITKTMTETAKNDELDEETDVIIDVDLNDIDDIDDIFDLFEDAEGIVTEINEDDIVYTATPVDDDNYNNK